MKILIIILMALLIAQISGSVILSMAGVKKFLFQNTESFNSSLGALLSPYMAHVLLLNSMVIIGFISLDIRGCERFLIGVCPVLTQCSLCFYFGSFCFINTQAYDVFLNSKDLKLLHLISVCIIMGTGFLIGFLALGFGLVYKNDASRN
jgi:hypothetical protein